MSSELGPAAMLRAAAWPIETLAAFGDAGWLQAGNAVALEQAYRAVLVRERRALWQRTAEDPRFMKALLFTSSSLYTRVRQAAGPEARRNKRVRHLETSLYRYLARAATRTAPNGLWAGVASVAFEGEQDELRQVPAHAEFAPDLTAFAAAFSVLSRRARYRDAAEFRVNPTLASAADGSFRFLARMPSGATEPRALAADAALRACLAKLRSAGSATIDSLVRVAGVPRSVIDELADGGVLVGGFAFPTRFVSAWQALEVATATLLGDDRVALREASLRLREACEALAADWDGRPLEALEPRLESARRAVAACLQALGLSEPGPADPLRCDLRLPFQVRLGSLHRRALEATLRAYERDWIRGASPLSALRRERRRALLEELATPLPLGSPLSSHALVLDDAARTAWAATFESDASQIALPRVEPQSERPESPEQPPGAEFAAYGAPWGSFISRLNADGVGFVLGIDDSPTRPWARHAALLENGEALSAWCQENVVALAERRGVRVAELDVPFEQNPNVLARPEMGQLSLSPWGTSGPNLADARLTARAGALLLDTPDGPLIALSLSSANALARDALAEQLGSTGFDEPVQPGSRASAWLHSNELLAPRYAPRLALADGPALRPRRTCLSGRSLARLGAARGWEAHREWQHLAEKVGWPTRLLLSRDGAAGLCVELSSPVALEAALEGVGSTALLIAEEPPTAEFLRGPEGNHVADLVCPFRREPHAFSGLAEKL